jgi:hypothetical protein
MTLRLTDEQMDALRRRAEIERDDDELTDRLAERGAERFAELLRRLGE